MNTARIFSLAAVVVVTGLVTGCAMESGEEVGQDSSSLRQRGAGDDEGGGGDTGGGGGGMQASNCGGDNQAPCPSNTCTEGVTGGNGCNLGLCRRCNAFGSCYCSINCAPTTSVRVDPWTACPGGG